MPNILSATTQKTLRLSHHLYEQAFEPTMMLRTNFLWQGKASTEFKSEAEKQAFFAQLKDKSIHYIVLCGKAMAKTYEQLKDNSRYSVLYFDPELIEANMLSQLCAVMQDKDRGIFFVSQDGYGDNGIPLFALACYEKLKAEVPHLFEIQYYLQTKKMHEYFQDSVHALSQFLLTCEKKYEQFIQPNKPAIAQITQFILAIEWVFQLIQQELQQIEKDEDINLKLSNMFKAVEKKYHEQIEKSSEEKILRIIKNISASHKEAVLFKKLSVLRRHMKIVQCCSEENAQQTEKLTVALIEKFKTFLLELPLGQVQTLIKKALPKADREAKFNDEVISQQYELYGNNWLSQQNYSEAKPWLILAYLLTDKLETEERLWASLKNTLAITSGAAISDKGTKGRTLLNSLEELSLGVDKKQKEELLSYGFDIKKQRRLSGKLFSLYCGMFILSKESIGSIQSLSGQGGFFPPVFLFQDKADLAVRHLIAYWKRLPKKPQLLTGKKDRAFLAFNDLVQSAHRIKIAEQDALYQKLQAMDLPAECLELFPCSQKSAKSFYSPIQAAPSTPPAPN